MTEIAQSPPPRKAKREVTSPTLMGFPAAMQAIIDGKRVTRQSWNTTEEYGLLYQGWLSIRKADSKSISPWKINDGDLLGTDWYVL